MPHPRFSVALAKGVAVSALAFSLLGVGGSAARAQRYTVTDLGTLGGADSGATTLNSYSYPVGRARTTLPTGEQHAAFFSVFWGVWDLTPTLPSPYQSVASGINDSFQICGYLAFGGGAAAWITTLGATYPTYIGTLGGNYSIANRINASGQVVGSSDDYYGHRRAYVWKAGSFTALGTLATAWTSYSFGDSINDLGHVVGDSGNDAFQQHAFFWPGSGPLRDLGTLGGDFSTAFDINNNDRIAGFSRISTGGARHAFYADGSAGPLHDLKTLGGAESFAIGVNNAGWVVGSSQVAAAASPMHGFVWRGYGPIIDLNTCIAPGSGWTIISASDINDVGDIAATGMVGGIPHACLLTLIPGT